MEWKFPRLNCLCFRTGLVIILTALLVVFAILPLHRRIIEESDEAQKIVVGMEHAREKVSRLGEYQGQYEKIQTHASEINLLLPESEFASFIAELENAAQESGGDIVVMQGVDMTALRKQEKGGDSEQPRLINEISAGNALSLSIRFSGSYQETIAFLHRLETLPYFLDVLAMDLTARDEESADPIVSSDVFLVRGTDQASRNVLDVPQDRFVDAVFDVVLYLE